MTTPPHMCSSIMERGDGSWVSQWWWCLLVRVARRLQRDYKSYRIYIAREYTLVRYMYIHTELHVDRLNAHISTHLYTHTFSTDAFSVMISQHPCLSVCFPIGTDPSCIPRRAAKWPPNSGSVHGADIYRKSCKGRPRISRESFWGDMYKAYISYWS